MMKSTFFVGLFSKCTSCHLLRFDSSVCMSPAYPVLESSNKVGKGLKLSDSKVSLPRPKTDAITKKWMIAVPKKR